MSTVPAPGATGFVTLDDSYVYLGLHESSPARAEVSLECPLAWASV